MGEKHCKPPAFRLKKTCEECPWRKDVPVGRFPPENFVRLRQTVEQGLNALFACHKSADGRQAVCVGYLMRCGENNWSVRLAAVKGRFDPQALEATGPLYDDFEQMARANGVKPTKRKRR